MEYCAYDLLPIIRVKQIKRNTNFFILEDVCNSDRELTLVKSPSKKVIVLGFVNKAIVASGTYHNLVFYHDSGTASDEYIETLDTFFFCIQIVAFASATDANLERGARKNEWLENTEGHPV